MNKHREVLERDLVIYQERQRIMSLNADLALKDNHATDAGYFRREADEAQERADAIRHALEIMNKVETLPKTADGVAVWPGDTVWVITDDNGVQHVEAVLELSNYDAHQVEETYSTEQAARDAAGESK